MDYRTKENARSAVENFQIARDLIAGGFSFWTHAQVECMDDSLAVLNRLLSGCEKMLANEDCGGDGWWDGWKEIKRAMEIES